MQKLSERNYIHTLECSTSSMLCDSELNKEEIPSVQSLKTSDNNSEVDQSVLKEQKQDLRVPVVYVLNMRGNPLMPCSCRKAKKLLKEKKAKVAKRIPFAIQLNYPTGEAKQNVTLGVDIGYSNIGFSAVSEKQELISGTVVLENKMVKRLEEKKMYRRGRRNKLWYRKPRFLNRVFTKKKGWISPSVERRFQTHISLIEKIKKLLPVSKLRIEVAKFDIQKLENDGITNLKYQQGDMYQYRNRIAYLIAREKGICQFCKKSYKKGDGWRLHHIWGKGKDRSKDWALLHSQCHDKLHKKRLEDTLRKHKSKSYKDSTFMNIVRWKFRETFPEFEITYGNITFQDRCDLDLEKSHVNDAFVIAKGKNQNRSFEYTIEQKQKNNRCLQLNRKGFKPSIRKQRYIYHPKDLIKVNNRIFEVSGIHSYGSQIKLKDLLGNILNKAVKKLDNFHFYQGTLKWRICGDLS